MTKMDFTSIDCSVALAYGKKISTANNISEHLIIRKSLVEKLVRLEKEEYNAIVPIPNAGIYLGECWAELSFSFLWSAFSNHNYNSSMFLISNQFDREKAAEIKLGKIHMNRYFSSIILIDEAITSGISMYRAIKTLKEYGVKNIHARTLLPPILPQLCPEKVIKYEPGNGLEKNWLKRPYDYKLIASCIGATDFSTLHMEDIKRICGNTCSKCIDY